MADQLNEPLTAMTTQLAAVDSIMRDISGSHPTDFFLVKMAIAQTHATCALVYAVRELTATLKAPGDAETEDRS